jgi:hypothetical protein
MKTCYTCGEKIPAERSVYCSQKCLKMGTRIKAKHRWTFRKDKIVKICPVCGKTFSCYPKPYKEKTFCCFDCRAKATRIRQKEKELEIFKRNEVPKSFITIKKNLKLSQLRRSRYNMEKALRFYASQIAGVLAAERYIEELEKVKKLV